jgi:hypothetical protein
MLTEETGIGSRIASASAYVPHEHSADSDKYVADLYFTLQANIAQLRAEGCKIVVCMDANAPRKDLHTASTSRRNWAALTTLLRETDLSVLNWHEGRCKGGFHTRSTGTSRSQLDLILVDRVMAQAASMTVNKHLRMGSDHYLLEVHIPVSCISKAIPIHTTQKRFDWTENNKQKYREISRGDLCEWALRHKFLDCEAEMLKKDAPSRIESATNKLVDIMITHFDKSAGARRTTTGHSLGNRITTDTKAATLARKRNEAQNNLEQAQWDLLPDEQVDHLQLIYTDSTRTLRDHFYQRELNAALDQKQSTYGTKLCHRQTGPVPHSQEPPTPSLQYTSHKSHSRWQRTPRPYSDQGSLESPM